MGRCALMSIGGRQFEGGRGGGRGEGEGQGHLGRVMRTREEENL